MTTELEPGALEAARRAYDETLRHDDLGDAEHVVRAYLSALSAPEAAHPGVDAKPVAWEVTMLHGRDEADGGDHWKTSIVTNPEFVRNLGPTKTKVRPLYAHTTPRPAAPTDGDIGALVERLNAATMRTDWNNLPDDACIPAVPLLREAATALAAMSAKLAASEAANAALRRQADGPWCQPMKNGEHQPRHYLVAYEDAEMGTAVFDDEAEARRHWDRANQGGWNCYLFGAMPHAARAIRGSDA